MGRLPWEKLVPTGAVDEAKVARYAQRNGDGAPPVSYVEDDGQYFIQDGNHRWFAAGLRGDDTIKAEPSSHDEEINRKWLGLING